MYIQVVLEYIEIESTKTSVLVIDYQSELTALLAVKLDPVDT